jgi:hypothetical protein
MGEEKRTQTRYGVLKGTLLVDGEGYDIADWSRNGWRVKAATAWSPADTPFDIVLGIRSDRGSVEVRGRGTIVRSADGFVAGKWDLRKPADKEVEALLTIFLEGGKVDF